MDGKRVILAAHRGDRAGCPENTMAAFRSALEFGCDMIETDIRMTKDGELVLIHDRSTLRTTGVDLMVDELTLEELQALDAGNGERVPTVREFCELIKDTDMLVNWEFKIYPADFSDEYAFGVVDKMLDIVEEFGLEKRSMMNSFSARVIEYICKKAPGKFPIHGQGIGICRRSKDEAEMPEEEMFDWCCLYGIEKGQIALECPEVFDLCNKNGIIPCICITDDYDNYKLAIELGCKMFTTNDMVKADEILRALGVR